MSAALCANYLFMSLKVHTHTHPGTHTARTLSEPGEHIASMQHNHQMPCILCGDPAAKFLKHMCSCLSSRPLFPLLSLSLSPSLQYLCQLPAFILGALFSVFSLLFDAFASLLILLYLPSICIRSTCSWERGHPLPPAPFKDKLNQFPIDRVMWCFFSSIFLLPA